MFGDSPGTLRLFNEAVGGQIGWLLPLVPLGLAAGLWHHRHRRLARAAIVLWTGWVLIHAVVFSYAKGIFHSYYTSALAPGLAALIGISGVALFREARRHIAWMVPALATLVGTAAIQVNLSRRAGSFYAWTRPLLAVGVVLAVVVTVAALVNRWRRHALAAGLATGLAALLVTPATWAASETVHRSLNATLPQAGPRGGAAGQTFGSARFDANAGLATYLAARDEGLKRALVTTGAQVASDFIATYDLSVLALGGFSGNDPAATISSVARMVQDGQVRYFLVDNAMGGGAMGGGAMGGGAMGGGAMGGGAMGGGAMGGGAMGGGAMGCSTRG